MWDNNEEEYEDSPEFQYIHKPDYVIVIIDDHSSMFKKINEEDDLIPIRICLKSLLQYAESLMFSTNTRRSNSFAVTIVGEANDDDNFFIDFKDNLVRTIKLLKSKLNESDDSLINEFQRKSDKIDLARVFFKAKYKLADVDKKKTILYITNDDKPDVLDKFTTFNAAQSLKISNVNFQMITMKVEFNYDLFYNELYSAMDANGFIEEVCINVEGMTQKFAQFLKKKPLCSPVQLYPCYSNIKDLFVSCLIIPTYKRQTLLNSKVTNDGLIYKGTKLLNIPTFSFKNFQMDFKKLQFTQTELKSFRNSTLPLGIFLCGINERSTKVGVNVKHPQLIGPNPNIQTEIFNDFWRYCVENDVVLTCYRKRQNPGKVDYCELIPMNLNDNSPVFLCKHVPWANECKPLPNETVKQLNSFSNDYQNLDVNKLKAVEDVVEKLTVDFEISSLPNMKLRRKKEYVKAKMLDEDVEQVVDDKKLLIDSMKSKHDLDFSFLNQHFSLSKRKEPAKAKAASKRSKKT